MMPITDEQSREIARLDFAANTAEAAERLKYQITFAEAIFRGLTLVNGGAIIALFTFIGNVSGKSNVGGMSIKAHGIWLAFGGFTIGLVLTLIAVMCAFFSQRFYYDVVVATAWNDQAAMFGETGLNDVTKPHAIGSRFMAAGIVAAGLSIVAFISGAALALGAVLPAV